MRVHAIECKSPLLVRCLIGLPWDDILNRKLIQISNTNIKIKNPKLVALSKERTF